MNPRYKLTPAQRAAIVSEFRDGAAMVDLATKYGVSVSNVSQTVRRLSSPLTTSKAARASLQDSTLARLAAAQERSAAALERQNALLRLQTAVMALRASGIRTDYPHIDAQRWLLWIDQECAAAPATTGGDHA